MGKKDKQQFESLLTGLVGLPLFFMAEEDEVKESVDEYEKDERLDLDDNEPEYEPEEYGGVDYDGKETEHEDVQEVENEDDEHDEENVGEEEEDDLAEGEMEDVPEEHGQGEEEVQNAGEEAERPEMVDAEEDDHHEMFQERRKRKEFEVFVGGLDKDVVEDDLRKVFSQVGEVTEVRLMMNPQTKKNKGFAFLRFATVEQARQAVTELKNPVVNSYHALSSTEAKVFFQFDKFYLNHFNSRSMANSVVLLLVKIATHYFWVTFVRRGQRKL